MIDGRNRYAACVIADVEPEYVTLDGDPLALVDRPNRRRRNLTAQQRAIIAAEAWELVDGTKEDSRAKKLARTFDVNHDYISRARALVERAPAAAEAVKVGEADLTGAYEALRAAERAVEGEQQRLAGLDAERERVAQRLASMRADGARKCHRTLRSGFPLHPAGFG